MASLPHLPPEILCSILAQVDPPDLAIIPRVCRVLYNVVAKNTSLFKQVYLRVLDEPPPDVQPVVDWEQAIKDLVRLQVVCRRASIVDKKDELPFVYDTVTSLLRNAGQGSRGPGQGDKNEPSRNARLLVGIFNDSGNQAAFLCRSFIYERARGVSHSSRFPSPPRTDHQKSAHLHCLYGVPILFAYPERVRHTRTSRMSIFACSKVYDLRQYTEKTMWGPFMNDDSGCVDWEKVEAIMIAVGANLKQLRLTRLPVCKRVWDTPFPGVWPNSYRPRPAKSSSSSVSAEASAEASATAERDSLGDAELHARNLDLEDPYGISGTWLRIVCFLDYTDFFAYNFNNEEPVQADIPRPALDVGEETRLILMKLCVTKIEPPGPEDGQDLPVVHFKGVAGSIDDSGDPNASSDIAGTVRLTRESEVRWSSISIFNGEEKWRSEAVQIGGPKSAKGVLGTWFDKDFDPRGPAGPTAFWKVSDRGVRRDGGNWSESYVMDDFMLIIGAAIEHGIGEDEAEELEGRIYEATALDV